ncbi:hypothetical protein KC19_VG067800 [Ceratodon purpureus]|uniref:Uncharacterized protein n=1 Tax=Ceratodon purpureus TaxID=3225 RepID=A0A8T0HMQ1_CERPU|nr:hypothetical protein KC19_VG067800 [Ceratodon purpureus]
MGRQYWIWVAAAVMLSSSVLTTAKFTLHVPHQLDAEWKNMNDIGKLLAQAVHLPLHSQKMLLKDIGNVYAKTGEGRCNIFGGSASCEPIPKDSDYSKVCANANEKVDCAFRMTALEHISKDPQTHFRKQLAVEGLTECHECYKNMHHFWCGQVVPSCGTFDKVIDEILPMLTAVAERKEKPSVALQQAVPRILQSASLGLPCKEMCDTITTTCGCGRAATFGEVMKSIQSGKHRDMYSTNMSLSTAKDIFQNVWNKPVCELFSGMHTPGFSGVCQVPESLNKCSWCEGKAARPDFVHEQIVSQMAQSISGLMQGGLEEILLATGGEKVQGGAGWSWTHGDTGSKKKSGGHSGVWAVLIVLLFVAAGAFVAAVKIQRNRQNPSQYVDLNSMGYTPPIL